MKRPSFPLYLLWAVPCGLLAWAVRVIRRHNRDTRLAAHQAICRHSWVVRSTGQAGVFTSLVRRCAWCPACETGFSMDYPEGGEAKTMYFWPDGKVVERKTPVFDDREMQAVLAGGPDLKT